MRGTIRPPRGTTRRGRLPRRSRRSPTLPRRTCPPTPRESALSCGRIDRATPSRAASGRFRLSSAHFKRDPMLVGECGACFEVFPVVVATLRMRARPPATRRRSCRDFSVPWRLRVTAPGSAPSARLGSRVGPGQAKNLLVDRPHVDRVEPWSHGHRAGSPHGKPQGAGEPGDEVERPGGIVWAAGRSEDYGNAVVKAPPDGLEPPTQALGRPRSVH